MSAIALLVVSLFFGVHSASASVISTNPEALSQQVASAPLAPSVPKKPCQRGGQNFGTCASGGFVALEGSEVSQLLPFQTVTLRFALRVDALLTTVRGTRLERPPRF